MHIALFIDTDGFGGAEAVVLELARAISQQNHRVTIFHFGNEHIVNFAQSSRVNAVTVPALKLYKKTMTLPLFARFFAKSLRDNEVDLLHSHLFGSVIGGALAAKLARIPHIGTMHDTYTLEEKPSRKYLLQIAVALGTHLIMVSKHMLHFYAPLLGAFGTNKLHLAYNGVESDPSDAIDLRSELALNENTKIICCVGRLVKLKRVDIIIESLNNLLSGNDFHLVIVGDGPEKATIQATLSSHHLGSNVSMLGHRSDVRQILKCCDLFIQFSETEGLSKSILEAVAAGLPCIVSNVGGNAEIIQDGYNGYVIGVNETNLLSENTKKILHDEDLQLSMCSAAQSIAHEKFSFDQFSNTHFQLYQSVSKVRGKQV